MKTIKKAKFSAKVVSLLIAFCMVICIMPAVAFAANPPYAGEVIEPESGSGYTYQITKDKLDKEHLVDVSKMADDGYTLTKVDENRNNTGRFKAVMGTSTNTVLIKFSDNFNSTETIMYDLTFTNDSNDKVVKYFEASVVNLDMNLAFCENNVNKDNLEITKGNSKTLTLYGAVGQIPGTELANYNIQIDNEKVATFRFDGDNIIVDAKETGTAVISADRNQFGIYNPCGTQIMVKVTDVAAVDGSSDVVVSFANMFTRNDMIKVGGEEVEPTGSPVDGGKMSGYPGYTGDIGEYAKGSTNVTLYADFIKYLQNKKVTVINVEMFARGDQGGSYTVSSIPVEIRSLQGYTVSFAPGEGTGTMDDVKLTEEAGEIGVDYTLPASTFTAPEGKEFDKWFINNPQTGENTTYDVGSVENVKGDITFTAQWKEVPKPVYNVSYEDGVDKEEITVPTDDKNYLEKDTVSIITTNPIREGYTFKGWKDESVTTAPVTITDGKFDMPARNVTLVAQWEEVIVVEDSPKTGDSNQTLLLLAMALLSLGGIAVTVSKRKIVK